jgi:hypothetical protein
MFTKKKRQIILFTTILFITLACGQFNIGIETSPPEDNIIEPDSQNSGLSQGNVPSNTETQTPETDYSSYWTEFEDYRNGIRYSIPCSWEAQILEPVQDPTGQGSYPIVNYTEEWTRTFPRGAGIWEKGAIKIDMSVRDIANWGFSPGISMVDYVNGQDYENSETELISIEELVINNQQALLVTTESKFGIGQYYLFKLSDELFFSFSAYPTEARENPDVQGILNSLALTSEASVQMPNIMPGNPPEGLLAPCLGITELPPDPDAPPEGCMAVSSDSVEGLSNKLQEYLSTGNTGGLVYELMNDPMMIGYWESEGAARSPNEMFSELANSLLVQNLTSIAEGFPTTLTFSTDRSQFPPLQGITLENMFGPDVNVVQVIYSEGWGADGLGAALLYIAQDDCGKYYWHGLSYSHEHFDK